MMVVISNIKSYRKSYNLVLIHFTASMNTNSESSGLINFNTNGEETSRSCRNKRKQMDPTCCPVCSVTLRNSEVDSHLASEIDRLYKISSKVKGIRSSGSPSSNCGKENGRRDKYWETYQKVRSNRQNRQRVKSPRRKLHGVICPVCNKETDEDITLHVDHCLKRTDNSAGDSDENIDVEGYEEYEWAGQSRVRATSLLEGGVSTIGTSVSMTDDDEDLIVDGDDSEEYGSPQYSERDVVVPGGEEQDALRKAVIGSDREKASETNKIVSNENSVGLSGDPVLEALKNRIKELESRDYGKDEVYKCLICMERYRTPVISVCCWHVHCEQCWLQTLGTKKLCPQCNMITSPANLRRIYM